MAALLALMLASCAFTPTAPSPEARQALAPTGKLRVGLIVGVPAQVMLDSTSGEMTGVAFDLSKELAKRARVPLEPVLYKSINALLDGGKSGQWDIAVIGFSAARTKEWDFTAPHLEIELGYLVPSGSSISALAEVDRPGIRIAVADKGQADRLLTPAIKVATLIRVPTIPDALELLRSGRADAFAGNKPSLFEMSNQMTGWRVIEGRFASDLQAMAMPKGRDIGIIYARRFVEEAKSLGLVKAAIERAGMRGAVVAPSQ
jgi:polar amino acid transport system substrate-binding protein